MVFARVAKSETATEAGRMKARASAAIGVAVLSVKAAWASPISLSDIMVERVGGDAWFNGSGTAATSAGTAVFIDEFAKSGLQSLPFQSFAMPTTASGSNLPLVESGSASSAGLISRTPDGSEIVISGYDSALGASPIT